MVEMAVADQHVTDVGRIEAELLEPAHHFVLDRVIEQRIDHDDAVRGRHGPRRELRHADEVEVVEYFLRIRVPAIAGRIGRLRGACGGDRRADRRGRRRTGTQPVDHARMFRACGGARGRHVPIEVRLLGGRDLRMRRRGQQQCRERAERDRCCVDGATCSHREPSYGSANTKTWAPPESAGNSGVTRRDAAATSDGPVVTATNCLPPTANVTG